MAQPIIFKITDAGKLAALNSGADAATVNIKLTQLAVGTSSYAATGTETALKAEFTRASIVSGGVEPASNTLRFSSTLTAGAGANETPVYELGLFTDDNVLFAIASSADVPLITLYPDVSFVIGFGLSLNDVDATNVTIVNDPNAPQSVVLMQQHLASPDPHPQYMSITSFQQAMGTLIHMGYLHYTHSTENPKPFFDAMLGMPTFWRRITGRIIVASDPNDPFINDYGITLGRTGLTTLAGQTRPHIYPLQTTHVFERYDPNAVIGTTWNVQADKVAIGEGDAVRFTVSATNLPDGQILTWTAKEGLLNAASNDIVAPEKTNSGTVIINSGQATIDFATTPDDNEIEPLKYVRLTIGAPANISLNVPISDKGFNETVVNITQSTNDGIILDEYYKATTGDYPLASDKIRFIVGNNVNVIAPDAGTPAIQEGLNWLEGSQIIVENRGQILGRGGNGGAAARSSQKTSTYPEQFFYDYTTNAQAGQDGGTAIKGNIKVDNYGLVAGGGGGGGGAGLYYIEGAFGTDALVNGVRRTLYVAGGGGSGGGAPYGARYPNLNTVGEFLEHFNPTNIVVPREKEGKPLNLVSMRDAAATQPSGFSYGVDADQVPTFTPVPELVSEIKDYTQFRAEKWTNEAALLYYSDDDTSAIMRQSANGALTMGGDYGYDIVAPFRKVNYVENGMPVVKSVPVEKIKQNHGGAGGNIGANGAAGVMANLYNWDGSNTGSVVKRLEPAAGGLAGYVSEGDVVINNIASGTTKGRIAP